MPLPLRRRVLRCCFPSSPQLPWPSSICAGLGSLFSLSRGLFDDAAEFTSCYGLVSCSPCSLPGTFVDALLRTDFAVRRHPSYSDVLALSEVRLSLTRGTRASGRAIKKRPHPRRSSEFAEIYQFVLPSTPLPACRPTTIQLPPLPPRSCLLRPYACLS